MTIKLKIIALMIITLFSLSLVSAFDVAETSNTNPDFFIVKDNAVGGSGSLLTTIGGALCSDYPTSGNTYKATADRICYTNNNYEAVALQLFQVAPDGRWYNVCSFTEGKFGGCTNNKEIQLKKGEKGCFIGTTPSWTYHYNIYSCEKTENSCSNWVAICSTLDGSKKTRTCSQTGQEEIVTEHVVSGLQYCEGVTPPLLDSGRFIGQPSVSTNKIKDGQSVIVTQTFEADAKGTYLLEAGIERIGGLNTLSAINIRGNTCNPYDKHFSNKAVYLTKGTHQISFEVTPVEGEGKYVYHTAYVTKCGKDGKVIQQINAGDRVAVLGDTEDVNDDEEEDEFPIKIIIGILAVGIVAFVLVGGKK